MRRLQKGPKPATERGTLRNKKSTDKSGIASNLHLVLARPRKLAGRNKGQGVARINRL